MADQRGAEDKSRLAGILDADHPLGPEVPETTLDQAVEGAPIRAFRPQTTEASDQSIDGVWVRLDEPVETFLRYANGVTVALRHPDFSDGFLTFYKGEIDQGYPGELTDVSGLPVFVVPTGDAVIEADLVVEDVFVQVVADDKQLTTESMTALVTSIIDSAKSYP